MYGCESWTLVKKEEQRLRVFERKVLRRIFGPVKEGGEWRRRYNEEIRRLYNEPDIVNAVKRMRIQWIGHVTRMTPNTLTQRVFNSTPTTTRPRGRPRKRWLDDVFQDLQKLNVNTGEERPKTEQNGGKLLSR